MLQITANYHTHTCRCGHARGADREYTENALRAGLRTLGFSDHSPMVFPSGHRSSFRVPAEAAAEYFGSIRTLAEEYRGRLRIFVGVETEYYPETFRGHLAFLERFSPDYMILGQHFLWREEDGIGAFHPTEDPARLASYYENLLEAAETGRFLYIAHPDVLNFHGDEAAYREITAGFLQRLKPLGIPLELNRLGFADGRHYPRRAFWELCGQMEIPGVIGLDAHDPEVFLDNETVTRLLAFADECGVKLIADPFDRV